jgi:ATP-binding cassette subfamily C protein CydC
MALGMLCGLLSVTSAIGLVALSGWFISAAAFAGLAVATAQLFNFFLPGIGVRLFAIGRTLARYAERIVSHDATFRMLQSLRSWFYIHLEPLAPSRLTAFRSGDILNRIVTDIDAMDNLYLRVLSPSAVALIMSLVVVGFLWTFDPSIAVSTAMYLLTAGVGVPALVSGLGKAPGSKLPHQTAQLRVRIVEGLQGLPELLVFGAYHRHLETVRRSSRALLKNQAHMSHIKGLSFGLITLLSGFAVLTALYLAIGLVNSDSLEGANLVLLVFAVLVSFESIWLLPSAYQYLNQTREAGRRLLELVNAKPTVTFPDKSITVPRNFGVAFKHVSFRYDEKAPWALGDVDFRIPSCGRVAVIGETGSGKSTLIHLLARFWDPVSGHICLGDEDIRNLSESDLRHYISAVTQKPHMFNATIKENLLIARPGAKDDELFSALESAQLIDFISGLPGRLDTWIGEAAKLMSGGQARRLAMARAILKNAPLWILDEPTEGLDPITERTMMRALKEQTTGRTLLLVTHRLVDLYWMDRIVMLDRGRIAAQGTHEELLQSNARYAALHMKVS